MTGKVECVRWEAISYCCKPGHTGIAADISRAMEQFREEYQVRKILELLAQASESKGRCKPVLAVGRDGISLREYRYRFFEVATAATVTVYDRRGRRLGTVYLTARTKQIALAELIDAEQ